jgi:hypothetical protein
MVRYRLDATERFSIGFEQLNRNRTIFVNYLHRRKQSV